ncbi:hypothetical protein [Streptomyces sp. NPDC057199]|uniref:hypothetical protein n=1 Tax=Streptomyces sp. NPDC057199 TaxID=3346047 RepID=UPI0036403E22
MPAAHLDTAQQQSALIRLVGVLAEQNDEWHEGRCYVGRELLATAHIHPIESDAEVAIMPIELAA